MNMDFNENIISQDNNVNNNQMLNMNKPIVVVQCENGHFFDVNESLKCPKCGALQHSENKTYKIPSGGKKGLFSFLKKDKEKNAVVKNTLMKAEPVRDIPDGPTRGFSENVISSSNSSNEISINKQPVSIPAVPDDTPTGGYFDIKFESQTINEASTHQEQQSSLNEQVKRVSANQGDKTMGFFSANLSGSKNTSTNIDPVVGWLVCVDGMHFGESFNIYTGRNSIGRSEVNKIILDKDTTVSRDKHCFVIFEAKKCEFIFMHGESVSLTYVNEETVYDKKQIVKNDRIQIGNNTLLFVPLCDESFKWEDFINKE